MSTHAWKEMGEESFKEARVKLERILLAHPKLRELVESNTALYKDNKKGPYYACEQSQCYGFLHAAGRIRIPGRHQVIFLGTLFICDTCGFHDSRR